MKNRVLLFLVVLLLLLTSCRVEVSGPMDQENNGGSPLVTTVAEHEFYAHKNHTEYGAKSSDEAGLTGGESGEITLEARRQVRINDFGRMTNFYYKHTVADNKNSTAPFDEYNRGYDVYHVMNTTEYRLLTSTDVICGYRKSDISGEAVELLSSIAYKSYADEFLYYIMPSGWKSEYTHYSYEMPAHEKSNFVATYTREIAGYLSDDVLKVEVAPFGEVCFFEGLGRKKYDILQNTVSQSVLSSAESELDKFLDRTEFKQMKKLTAYVVTDDKGALYLKKELRQSDGKYFNTFFVKIPVSTLQMTDEYREMVEENYEINKALDNATATTTKNRLINDQNSETIAKFKYGSFSASYNSCGAIAVHNAKILLGSQSMLSDTIYDIQSTAGITLGGMFGSGSQTVPEVMKKYGIKCTEVAVNQTSANGVYIISFWQNNPPWNGTHTVAVMFDGKKHTAYNLYGDGSTYTMDIPSYGDRIISCYKLG